MSQKKKHRAYQEIMAIGMPTIPFMLKEMKRNPMIWVNALQSLTGVNPAKARFPKSPEEISGAWIKWGRAHGYIA